MNTHQLNMFDLMVQASEIRPIDPYGPVVEGPADHTLRLEHPKMAWDIATIEIHRCQESRKWMWSTASHTRDGGGGYKVGPKWGKFAPSASDALHWAKDELFKRIGGRASAKEKLEIETWAAQLSV
jgi:hypothetical protein